MKNRSLSFILLTLCLTCSVTLSAADFTVDGIGYNICSNTPGVYEAEVAGYNHCSGSIIIPQNVYLNGIPYKVVRIGDYAFVDCYQMTGIALPASISAIGENAFYNCHQLTEISLPENVVSIGNYAFYNCGSFTSVHIPQHLSHLGQNAFCCRELESFSVDSRNTHFCTQDGVLFNHAKDTLIAFPGARTGNYILPDDTRVIAPYAFYNCDRLKALKLNDGLTEIKDFACTNCDSLSSVSIPSSVKRMESSCFAYCSQLEVYFNRQTALEYTGYDIFGYSSSTDLYVPKAFIDAQGDWFGNAQCREYAFRDDLCPSTFEIRYQTSDGGILVPSDTTPFNAPLISNTYENGWGVLTFEGMVTTVGEGAFKDCTRLTKIVLPDGMKHIEANAFSGCSSLAECNVPYSLSSVGRNAFAGCRQLSQFSGKGLSPDNRFIVWNRALIAVAPSGLTSCTIPGDGSITTIAQWAFSSCSDLTEITIPDGVTTIGGGFLAGCSNLATINSRYATSDKKALIQDGALKGIAPAGLSSFKVPDEVTAIDVYCFADCQNLTEIHFGNSLQTIGEGAFLNCTGLTLVNLPDQVTAWPKNLFKGCTGLTQATIHSHVASLGSSIFDGCTSLRDITYNAENALISSTSPTEMVSIFPTAARRVTIGENVQSIPSYLFCNDTGLEAVTLPENLTSLGEYIFYGCTHLDSIFCSANPPVPCQYNTFEGMGADAHIYVPRDLVSTYEYANGWNSVSGIIYPDDTPREKSCLYYTSSDGQIVTPHSTSAFNCKLFSNTYENGQGVITFADTLKSIGYEAFGWCQTLESITLPTTVTEVDRRAFYGCTGLQDIALPDHLTTIGTEAFQGCEQLRNITLPETLASIGIQAFYNCTALDSVVCKALTPPAMEWSVFDNNAENRMIYVPQAAIEAYEQANYWSSYKDHISIISNGTAVTQEIHYTSSDGEVIIPGHYIGAKIVSNTYSNGQGTWVVDREMTYLATDAFRDESRLTGIDLPATIQSVKDNAFYECSALKHISLPDSLKTIDYWAFYNCDSLTGIAFPDSLKTIGYRSFYDCGKLETITLPEKLTSIDDYAFQNCSHLKTVYCLGSTPANISSSALYGLPEDVRFFIPLAYLSTYENAGGWSNYKAKMYIWSDTTYTLHYTSSDSAIVVPHVSRPFNAQILSNTCENGQGTLVLDRPVTAIYESAFRECNNLVSIEIPETVSSIPNYVFFNCSALKDISLSDSLKTIGSEAFYQCSSLTEVTLSDSLKTIGNYAFYWCSNLKTIYCSGSTPANIYWDTFNGLPENARFFIPAAYMSDYENAYRWSDYKAKMYVWSDTTYPLYYTSIDGNVVTPNDNCFNARILSNEYKNGQGVITFDRPILSIGQNAFQGKDYLSTITIPGSVTSIGDCAFSGCSLLKTCEIPEGVTSIGQYAFQNCSYWPGCTLPQTLNDIGGGAFEGCTNLKRMVLPPKVKVIKSYTFDGCSNLKELQADSVTELEPNALYGCGLETFTLPAGITTLRSGVFQSSSIREIIVRKGVQNIEPQAFADCNNLEKVSLPEGLKVIPERLFANCGNLKEINLPASVDSILDGAFYYCRELPSVLLPVELKFIGREAFYECDKLSSITLPNRLGLIGQYAFAYTDNLSNIYCTDSVPTPLASANVFDGRERFFIVPAANIDSYKEATIWDNFKDNIYPDSYQPFEIHYTSADGLPIQPSGLCKGNSQTGYTSSKLFYNRYENGVGTWGFIDTITSINPYAFQDSPTLQSITLPSTITRIGGQAFYNCQNLQTVNCLATTPPELQWSAFEKNAPARKILVPEAAVSTYEEADGWKDYKFSIFSDTYKDEGQYVITYTAESAVTPDLSQNADFGGAKLYSNTFKDGTGVLSFDREVTKIAAGAFKGKALTSIRLPETVTSISSNAFESCTSLKAIRLPENLASIGADAFSGCTSLDSVICTRPVPPTCGSGAFDDNAPDRIIYVDEQYVNDYENAWYAYKSSIFANSPEKSVIYYTSTGNATITPTDVTALGAKVLSNTGEKDGKRIMQLDRLITTVGPGAFSGQNRIESIELPEGVTSVGANAFKQCLSLKSVVLPQTLNSIGVDAFAECKALSTINLPSGILSVGSEAFLNCSSLKRVHAHPLSPPSCGSKVFEGNTSNRRICVPDSAVTAYRKASGWSDYKVYIVGESSPAAQSDDEITVVETPAISLYNHTVTITCSTPGATIRYTTDGTDPSEESTVYHAPFAINSNCTVQAYASKEECFDSGTASFDCADFIVQMPVISFENDSIAISCGTDHSSIYYTTDGTEPTINSTPYSGPFRIAENLTIKAFATRSDYTNSPTATYNVDEFFTAAPVIFTNEDNLIEITCATEGARVYYTTDNSEPTSRSTLYASPFDPKTNCLVRAIAVCNGLNNSNITSYQVELYSTALPVITLTEDNTNETVKVNISCATSGSTIHYTVDGTEPDMFSSEYKGTFTMEQNGTVKAFASSASLSNSRTVTKEITSFTVSTPVIDTLNMQVVLSCATGNSTIYYTTDGTTPTKGSSVYDNRPIDITHNLQIRAMGTRSNFNDSEIAALDLDLFKVQTPFIHFEEGKATLSCGTEEAVMYYTTDGTDPLFSGLLYRDTPFAVNSGETIRAVGTRKDYSPSDVAVLLTYLTDAPTPVIRFDGESFWFETSEEVDAIHYTLDNSYPTTLSASCKAEEKIVLPNFSSIRAISTKEGSNNSPAAGFEPMQLFKRGEMTAYVKQPGLLEQCFAWCNELDAEAIVSVNGLLNEVDLQFIRHADLFFHLDLSQAAISDNALPDSAFSGSSLISVILPSSLKKAGNGLFCQCPNLAAVVWEANLPVPDNAMTGIDNPNFLLYVPSQVYAPTNVSNVVSNGNATRITLTSSSGNCNFYAPRSFTAYSISYTRTFGQITEVGQCSGWETIALPFEAQTIRHASKGQISPFGTASGNNSHFWLYSLSGTGFMAETVIQPYRPYLISMPHNTYYASASDLGGDITFSASYTVVQQTAEEYFELNKRGSFVFHPNFIQKKEDEKYLVLNAYQPYNESLPGSVFVSGLKEVKPFEGYIQTSDIQNASILHIGGGTTGLEALQTDISEALTLTPCKQGVRIQAHSDVTTSVFSLQGQLVRNLTLSEGEVMELTLKPGIYMIGNQRVLVKE